MAGRHMAWVIAAVLFTIAALTDFADGYLARRWHITTTLGAFLDSVADKVLVMSKDPGRIREEIPVALPRPRSPDSNAFLHFGRRPPGGYV